MRSLTAFLAQGVKNLAPGRNPPFHLGDFGRLWDLGFGVLGLGFEDLGLGFHNSALGFQGGGLGFEVFVLSPPLGLAFQGDIGRDGF